MATVAELLVQTLESANVKRIYGIVGDSLNGITNALGKNKKISWIHTRNEEAAAFAAGAESQLTGELTVCAGSCGPGNLHLINGLYDCHRSKTPVLAIAAHIPTSEIGGEYFQETHPNILFQECSCYCEIIESPEQMPRILKIAMQTAIAERGVAVIVISGDLALKKAEEQKISPWVPLEKPIVTPSKQVLQEIATHLNEANKITIFTGIGSADAHQSLLDVCEKLKSPVVHTLRGKPHIEYDNPYDVGMTGLIGFSSGYYAMESCDVLLLLGTSFPYRQFYPTKSKIIQIDIEGKQLGKRCDLIIGAIGDIDATLQALLPLLEEKKSQEHLDKAREHYLKSRKNLDGLAGRAKGSELIHPQYLAKNINDLAAQDAAFTADVGTPTVWAARYLSMNGQRDLIGSFNHGSMANALSQAIGIQCAYPKRQVVALCGDGGFSMLMGEMLTLIQHQLPIKIVIFNNGTLGFVEMEMHVGGMLEFGTELKNPNFAAMAEAAGFKGIRIDKASSLPEKLKEGIDHPGPVIIDVAVNRSELIMPPTLELEQVKGFSLYMMKAIINGQGDEVIEVMNSNLWRRD